MVSISRKSFLTLSAAGATAAVLGACSNNNQTGATPSTGTSSGAPSSAPASTAPTTSTSGMPAAVDADLVIWADDLKSKSLKAAAEAWGTKNGLKVAVQTVATDLQTNFVTANQAKNGPDIVLGAHDWIGNLVQNNAITTVQLPADASTKLAAVGIEAMKFAGQTYGVPFAVETLVLYVNKKLTDNVAPKSIEEMVTAGKAKGAERALSLPVGEKGDAYHMQPFYTSGGGYLFGKNSDGSLNAKDLGVGKPGSITAAEKIGALGKDKVLSKSVTGENAIALFTGGKAAYLISGPWALADIKKAKIDFAIAAIPGFQGLQPASPFAGVNGFYAATNGKNQGNAQTFLNEVASSSAIAGEMFKTNQLPPVALDLQASLAGANPEMVQIAKFAEAAQPMPAIPAMASVWAPLGQAQANIVGGANPKTTMESAGKEIASKI